MDLILTEQGELIAPSGLALSVFAKELLCSADHGALSKLLALLLFFLNEPGVLLVLIFIKQSSGLSQEFAS